MNCPFGIICSIDNTAGLSINLNGNCAGGILHLSGADFKGFSDRLKHAAAKLIVDNRRENHAENLRGMTRAVMNVGGSLVGNRLYSNGVNSARLGASCACDIIRSKLARPGLVLNREVSLYSRRIGECFGALAVLLELTVNKAVYTADKLIDDGGHSGDFAASVVRLRNSCNALRTGLNAVNGLVEIRNYLSLCRGLGSSAAAALIAALAAAASLGRERMEEHTAALTDLKAYALETFQRGVPGLAVVSPGDAPHICAISLPGYPSQVVVRWLSDRGFCVSSGSACHRGKASHVYAAMHLSKGVRDGVLRISFGPENTRQEVDQLAQALLEATRDLVPARG